MNGQTLLRERELDRLQKLASSLHAFTEIEDLAWHVVEEVGDICGLEDCVFYVRLGNVLNQVAALGVKRVDETEILNRLGIPLGAGIVGAVGLTGKAEYVSDVTEDERYIHDEYAGLSEFAVPFVYRDEVLGVLDSESNVRDGFSGLIQESFKAIASLVAPHLAALLQHHERITPNFAEVISELTRRPAVSDDDLHSTFANITERASRSMRVSRAEIWILDEPGTFLEAIDAFDLASGTHSPGLSLQRSHYPRYFDALEKERVLRVTDARQDERTREFSASYLEPFDIVSVLIAPIRIDRKIAGVISLQQIGRTREWNQEEANFVGTLSDIATIALVSERKRDAESALAQSQRIEALGRLAGGIAHDFNNLLMVISGAVETFDLGGCVDERQRRSLDLIADASDRASRLTRKLVAFGGTQHLDISRVPVAKPVQEVQELSASLIREDIETHFQLSDENAYIDCDTQQLSQVLLNLVINAIDAMPLGGELRVSVDVSEKAVVYSVSDTGVGIDASVSDQIFEPFYTTKGDMGSGLGLSSSLGIVKQHDGEMSFASAPGQGTTFELVLPRVASALAPQQFPDSLHSTVGGQALSILLVEDEPEVRNMIFQMLTALGYHAEMASTATNALEILQAEHEFDLLVTDIVMPDIRGTQLFEKIAPANPGLRVLFVSGYNDEMLSSELAKDPRVNFLAKPFSLSTLRQAIEDVISR